MLHRAFLALTMLTLTAGCSSGAAPAADPELGRVVNEAQRTISLANRAENVVVAECMREHGFEYHGPTDPSTVEDTESDPEQILAFPVSEAEEHGYRTYHAERGRGGARLDQGAIDYRESLSADRRAAYDQALQGDGDAGEVVTLDDGITIPVEGCVGEGMEAVFDGDVARYWNAFNTVQYLGLDAHEAAKASESYTAALDQWVACMSEQGHDVDSLDAAVSRGQQLASEATEPSPDELELAVADATCRDESDIAAVFAEEYLDAQARFAAAQADQIREWQELEAELDRTIREIFDRAAEG